MNKICKNNLVLFTIIGLVVGFLVGYLVFGSSMNSTGNAKSVTKLNSIKGLSNNYIIVDKDNNMIVYPNYTHMTKKELQAGCCSELGLNYWYTNQSNGHIMCRGDCHPKPK